MDEIIKTQMDTLLQTNESKKGRKRLIGSDEEKRYMEDYRSEETERMQKAKDFFVENYIGYIEALIRLKYTAYEKEYFDDMVNSGVEGILKAMDNYDPDTAPFSGYVYCYIISEIDRCIREITCYANRYYSKAQKIVRQKITDLENTGKTWTNSDIAEQTNIRRKTIDRVLNMYKQTELIEEVREQTPSEEGNPEDIMIKKEQSVIIEKSLAELDSRSQCVIRYRFGLNSDGETMTWNNIAEKMKITIEQVKYAEKKGLKTLYCDKDLRQIAVN
jgi:RNA polymerase sigma factor for flagellar operon FliA